MNKLGANVKLFNRAEELGLNSDIGLVKNYYYHITYGEVITGFEIYNPTFYGINLLIFNKLWESLE
jgi:hypothetical protein